MSHGVERVVYISESVFDLRELNTWVLVDSQKKGCGVHIELVQDAQGEVHTPVFESNWQEVCDGIASRKREKIPHNYAHELRIDSLYLPVRVRFCSWSQSADGSTGEHSKNESRYWVRYIKE